MSTSTAVLGEGRSFTKRRAPAGQRTGGLDMSMILGIAIAAVALFTGVAVTGVSARYFFQPTGILIVVVGTLGVMLITTPRPSLLLALRRTVNLFSMTATPAGAELVEELVSYAKVVRTRGLLAL